MKELSREAIEAALKSAGVEANELEAVAVGNAMAGLITGQECIRGQVVLREMGIGGIPVINTENACASAATAFHLAWLYVASGMYDVVLALGMEKLYHEDKKKSFAALGSAIDVELMQQTLTGMKQVTQDKGQGAGAGKSRSMFMDFYAEFARSHMRKYGTTKEQYAGIAAKNHTNGSLNPHAQLQTPRSVEDILASPMIADPLTRMMCSPIGDGAAAVVLTSADKAKEFTTKPVYVKASVLGSGQDRQPGDPGVTERIAQKAYEIAGIGPEDLDVAEVHDASAPAELIIYEELGLCQQGEGGRLIDEGFTALGGKTPVNPSGGLLAKGH
ncbi:MAG: thiolase family protein, partial [Lysobacterales bacterium]